MSAVRRCVLRGCKWPWRASGREHQPLLSELNREIPASVQQLLLAKASARSQRQREVRSCHTSDRVRENSCRPSGTRYVFFSANRALPCRAIISYPLRGCIFIRLRSTFSPGNQSHAHPEA